MKKRILSVFMALTMMLTLLPTAALAADATAEAKTAEGEVVAYISHTSGNTALTVNIWLDDVQIATTGVFQTQRASNRVEITPIDASWNLTRSECGNGSWAGEVLTLYSDDSEKNIINL